VKVISRSVEDCTKERSSDLRRIHKNADPLLHPFERAREYTRAMNATKMERMFAKPFVGALAGHKDGVFSLVRHPSSLTSFLSGSCDGEIKVWNLSSRVCFNTILAHSSFVRGLTFAPNGDRFLSCGSDKTIKMWQVPLFEQVPPEQKSTPKTTFLGKDAFLGLDHQKGSGVVTTFATCASDVEVWDYTRSEPVSVLNWGTSSIPSVAFNPVELHCLASIGTDRNISLYDIRGQAPIRKVILKMRSNQIAWNPMEAFNFTVANEDGNCYSFDMRNLMKVRNVHKGHVGPVLTLDYSPTGQEFVSGSYDKSLRIFGADAGHSREIYHTTRMQRIFQVRYSGDSRFVLSGSDDTNIRLWKAYASEKIGVLSRREKESLAYSSQLRARYSSLPEVARIQRHRHVPKPIKSKSKLKVIMKESKRKKARNIKAHSRPGSIPVVREREKAIVSELE